MRGKATAPKSHKDIGPRGNGGMWEEKGLEERRFGREDGREGGMDVVALLRILLRRRRMILAFTLGAAVVAAVASLLLPPVYRAETKILPPQQGGAGIAAQILGRMGGAFGGLLGTSLGVKTQGDLIVGMLKSRTVLDTVVDRFDLVALYGVEYREDARRRLFSGTRIQLDERSEVITVSVEDRDPKRAADMANTFVAALRDLSSGLALTEAAQRRLFFEEQLRAVEANLAVAEDAVRGFQEETGALEISAQARAVIEGIASLRAQIIAREVQAQVMRAYATSENPDLQRIEEEVKGLRAALARLEEKGQAGPDPLMPAGRLPSVGTEYLRKLRDLKYNETLFEVLAQQYEMARIDEAREAAVIQVIDRAVPPERRAWPKRSLMTVVGMLAGFVLSLFISLLLEFLPGIALGLHPRAKSAESGESPDRPPGVHVAGG
jgi:tyrosine-protein kinase Etk/Wzc